jgi:uncharacterized membrane protein YcjF (UPF0283 family)
LSNAQKFGFGALVFVIGLVILLWGGNIVSSGISKEISFGEVLGAAGFVLLLVGVVIVMREIIVVKGWDLRKENM